MWDCFNKAKNITSCLCQKWPRDEKLKASVLIALLQFKIWLIREIPPLFREAGMRRQEKHDACSKWKIFSLKMTHWAAFTCRIQSWMINMENTFEAISMICLSWIDRLTWVFKLNRFAICVIFTGIFIQHIYYHVYSKWNKLYYFSGVALELHQIRAYEE